MTLYEKIITQDVSTDPKAFLAAINLADGWTLLDMLPFEDRKQKMIALKFCARLFDPVSELQTVSDRLKAKKSELKQYTDVSIDDNVWVDIIIGNNKYFNDLVSWYYQYVSADEPLKKASIMIKELMHNQLMESMAYPEQTFVDQKGQTQGLPEEKRLKNMAYKQDCAERYIENIKRIESIEREIQTKYEVSDANLRNEIKKDILDNSGETERFAAKIQTKNK